MYFLITNLQVPGVGKGNGFGLKLNARPNNIAVKYRVYISEIGTTYSKVYLQAYSYRVDNIKAPYSLIHYLSVKISDF